MREVVVLAPPVMQRVLVYTAGFFQKFTITPTAFTTVIAGAIAMKYLCARLIIKDFFIRSGLGRYRNNIVAVILPLALIFVMSLPYGFAFIFKKWLYMGEPISKVLAFFVNFTFDRAVEPFYGITLGFFAKKA